MKLLLAVLLTQSVVAVQSAPAGNSSSSDSDLADDTLFVLLAPHTDRQKAIENLQSDLNATVINDLHVNKEDYSILQLNPGQGQRETTLNKLLQSKTEHPEYLAATRNHLARSNQGNTTTVPDDQNLPDQWPLANMQWTRACTQFSKLQKRPARLTILGTSFTPVSKHRELGQYTQEYNTLVSPAVNEGIVPPGSVEGNIDSSITSCVTNNGVFLAGAGCFRSDIPCMVTIGRICSPADNESTSKGAIYGGVTWAINNQRIRGGPGPVNLSYNDHADPCGTNGFQYDQICKNWLAVC